MATSKQAKKLIEVFEDLDTEMLQEILSSGVLAVVRDRLDLAQSIINVARGLAEIKPIDHVIDLSIPCRLPFDGAERVSPAKSGVVRLEHRDDDLYLDGQKIELVFSERQKNGKTVVGHELRIEREKLGGNLGGSVLDHLVEHPELWPESWKKDSQGRTVYVFFWGDIFRGPALIDLCVRYGCWDDGRVVSGDDWLGYVWGADSPAASLAS